MTRRDHIAGIQQGVSLLVRGALQSELHEYVGERSGHRIGSPYQNLLTRIVKGEPAILNELAKDLGRDQSTVSRQVAVLEGQGLVLRRPHPQDGRSFLLEPTPEGRRVFAELFDSWLDTIDEMVGDREDADVAALAASLSDLAGALNQFVDTLREGDASEDTSAA